MSQALRTITARVLADVQGSAALLGASLADELSVFVRPMFFFFPEYQLTSGSSETL